MSRSTRTIAAEGGARLHVAVGVITDRRRRVLVAQRHPGAHQGGLWEFPGGKVEAGEAVLDALRRELLEELSVTITSARPLLRVPHDYGDRRVLLDVWWVDAFAGGVRGREGQPILWAEVDALASLAFPAANRPIVQAVVQRLSQGGADEP